MNKGAFSKRLLLIFLLAFSFTGISYPFKSSCLAPHYSPFSPYFSLLWETLVQTSPSQWNSCETRKIFHLFELEASKTEIDILKERVDFLNDDKKRAIESWLKRMISRDAAKHFSVIRSLRHHGNNELAFFYSAQNKKENLKAMKELIRFFENPNEKGHPKFLWVLSHVNPDIDTFTSAIGIAFLFHQLKVNSNKKVMAVIEGKRENLDPTIEFLMLSVGLDPDSFIYYDDTYNEDGERTQTGFTLREMVDSLEKHFPGSRETRDSFRDKYLQLITADHHVDMNDKRLLYYLKGIVDHHSLDPFIQEKNLIEEGFQNVNQMLLNENTRERAEQILISLEEQRLLSNNEKKVSPDFTPFNSGMFNNGSVDFFYHWRLTGCCATLVSELYRINQKNQSGNQPIIYPAGMMFLLKTAIHMDTEWLTSDRYSTFFDGQQKEFLKWQLDTITSSSSQLINCVKEKHLYLDLDDLSMEHLTNLIKQDSKYFILDLNGRPVNGLISSIDISTLERLTPSVRDRFFKAMKKIAENEKLIYLGIRWASWDNGGAQELWSYSPVLYSPTVNEAIQRKINEAGKRITQVSHSITDHLGINLVFFPKDKPQRKQLKAIILAALWDEINYKRFRNETIYYFADCA